LNEKEYRFWTPLEETRLGFHDLVTSSRQELAEAMVADCKAARRENLRARFVSTANGQGISLAETNPAYKDAIAVCDVVHADGGFIVALSRFLGKNRIKERSATTDLIHDCAELAAQNGLSFYLLGSTEKVNKECAEILERNYPGLKIVGRRNGYFKAEDDEAVIEEINVAKPDVLWVGMGKPKEALWTARWRERIKAGWIVTCGGCYHFVTGDYARAPLWMQKFGLEWVYRASTERRLLFRYLTTNPHALWIIARGLFEHR
jgi:N-acetylglucosaminyldiphosphoundecaprenol N-acetyl-beta-D-mannosaminyltransferase